jgi:hypothetical protein
MSGCSMVLKVAVDIVRGIRVFIIAVFLEKVFL